MSARIGLVQNGAQEPQILRCRRPPSHFRLPASTLRLDPLRTVARGPWSPLLRRFGTARRLAGRNSVIDIITVTIHTSIPRYRSTEVRSRRPTRFLSRALITTLIIMIKTITIITAIVVCKSEGRGKIWSPLAHLLPRAHMRRLQRCPRWPRAATRTHADLTTPTPPTPPTITTGYGWVSKARRQNDA